MSERKARVLVVDDDVGLLRLLAMRLGAAGYEVDTATSGEQALGRLSAVQPQLVITDLRMGGMDGMALYSVVHARQPALPVIILTAHGTIPDAVQATQRGVFGYLTKPFDSKILLDYVKKAVRLSGELSPTVGEETERDWRRDIISRSAVMDDLLHHARLVAGSDASVLIQGESGTGKELLARAIHRASRRAQSPFLGINCSAIPETLLESELFGHNKGSFTGATQNYKGLFQAAHGGSLFLDEIGDMPLAFQAKLLRVLQEKEVRPVGSTEAIPVDVRIISATHHDLEQAAQNGQFRDDLYYRLNVVMLELPGLAQRREDIPLLATHFLGQLQQSGPKKVNGFSQEAMELLVGAPWPGNVRQLWNVIEQTVALSTSPIIPAALVQRALRDKPRELPSFAEARDRFERDYLVQLLRITGGNVTHAARLAQRNRTEFYKLLRRYHLDPVQFRGTPASPA